MRRVKADLALLLITLIWGSTFVVVKGALDTVGPLVFVASRFWLAVLVLGGAVLIFRLRPGAHGWRDGIIAGCCLAVGYITQTIALQTSGAGKTAFITGLCVVLVPIFSALLLRQAPSRPALAGVVMATIGLGLMTLGPGTVFQPGDGWALVCVLGFALQIIATARFAPRHPVLWFTFVQLLTVAVLTTAAALVFEREALWPAPTAWPSIIYMAWGATALVFGLQSWGQRYTSSTHAAVIFALEPVFGAIFAAIFAQEFLTPVGWVGGGLILLGMLASELNGLRS